MCSCDVAGCLEQSERSGSVLDDVVVGMGVSWLADLAKEIPSLYYSSRCYAVIEFAG